MSKIAKSILFIFQPALIPVIAIVFLFYSNTYISLYNSELKIRLMLIILVTSFLLPISLIPLFYGIGIIKNLKIDIQKDKVIFLIIIILANILTFLVLKTIPIRIDKYLLAIFASASLISLISIIISSQYKICIHSLTFGSFSAFIASFSIISGRDYILWLISIFFICGLLGFAKSQLEKNTNFQIYSSFVVGFFINLIFFMLI